MGTTGFAVRITYPFHPANGQTFYMIGRSPHWGDDRVIYRAADETLPSIVAAMTEMEQPDAFRRVAAGRSTYWGPSVDFPLNDKIEGFARSVQLAEIRIPVIVRALPRPALNSSASICIGANFLSVA